MINAVIIPGGKNGVQINRYQQALLETCIFVLRNESHISFKIRKREAAYMLPFVCLTKVGAAISGECPECDTVNAGISSSRKPRNR